MGAFKRRMRRAALARKVAARLRILEPNRRPIARGTVDRLRHVATEAATREECLRVRLALERGWQRRPRPPQPRYGVIMSDPPWVQRPTWRGA